MGVLGHLWPRSLVVRIVVLLVLALAAAQIMLGVLFVGRQEGVVAEMGHSQALAQMVSLTRLVEAYPPSEGEKIASAFSSRQSCASISTAPPPPREMTEAERDLSHLIRQMMHNSDAGVPDVTISSIARHEHPCGPDARPYGTPSEVREPEGPPRGDLLDGFGRNALIAMAVPLADRRWVTMRMAIERPGGWTQAGLASFLLSSLIVAGVAILSIRSQTNSLRALAQASERLGRGETVAPLAEAGPSEVASAAHAFNTMQERLRNYLTDRLKLLAGISHDLRTPLTTLRLKAELLDDAAARDSLIATIEELTKICEATLAFSRAEATSEESQRIDLAQMLRGEAEAYRMHGEEVTVESPPGLSYACRPVALKRAVRNLIDNAVRYGGAAHVQLARRADGIVIAVEDTGPGIPAEQVEEAFKPFVRLETSRSADTGGMGLGLSIARSIAKAHGGELVLANRAGGGLRAEITLPL